MAVEHCHKNSIIHHDLKPENILISTDKNGIIDQVKLADFGHYRSTSEHLEVDKTTGATLAYAAPELLKPNEKYDERIDYWSLGVLLF